MSVWSKTNFDTYAPDLGDQRIITVIAGEALTIGQVVEITGDGTVKASTLTATSSAKVEGVCLTNAVANGPVSVIRRGLTRVIAYGTVNAGDQVGSATGGTVQTVTAGSGGTGAVMGVVIGKCLVGASSGGSAFVLLNAS
jgi:uncharacterized protein YaaW (UPF0174 family)